MATLPDAAKNKQKNIAHIHNSRRLKLYTPHSMLHNLRYTIVYIPTQHPQHYY